MRCIRGYKGAGRVCVPSEGEGGKYVECQRAQGGRGVCGASEEEGESMWCVRGHMEDGGRG